MKKVEFVEEFKCYAKPGAIFLQRGIKPYNCYNYCIVMIIEITESGFMHRYRWFPSENSNLTDDLKVFRAKSIFPSQTYRSHSCQTIE
jgi:hypothetical protein